MEKLRLAKKTNPHASFHWSKSNFVSPCGSIRLFSAVLQAMKKFVQKQCTQELCGEATSYPIIPKMELSKAPQLTPSVAELCSCCSLPAWAQSPGVP